MLLKGSKTHFTDLRRTRFLLKRERLNRLHVEALVENDS